MNAIVVTSYQRKARVLLTCFIAGVCALLSVPAFAATGAIYDAHETPLTITAVKSITCGATLHPKKIGIGKTATDVVDADAGTVEVTCATAAKVALAIAASTAGPYTDEADGTPSGGVGKLHIKLGGGSNTSLAAADNHSTTKAITSMSVAAAGSAATFTLIASAPAPGVTAAGDFTYSLVSAAWVE